MGFRAVSVTRLSYLSVYKFRIVIETRRNRPRIVRNRCVPVCGHRAGYFGLGFAELSAQTRLGIEDFGRILQSVRGPFSSAEVAVFPSVVLACKRFLVESGVGTTRSGPKTHAVPR
jgi:hypothetical protein